MPKGNSLVVEWLGLRTFTAEGLGSIPGRGTKISQAASCGQKKKKGIPKASINLMKYQNVIYVIP